MNGTHAQFGIGGNVQIDEYRRCPRSGLVLPYRRQRVHNIVTTAGLAAWAYNLVNTDGQVIDRLVIGDDNTAPAAGDTALGNQTASYSEVRRYLVGDTVKLYLWIAGSSRDSIVGTNVDFKEIGCYTANSGATASSNKLVARAVLDVPVTFQSDTYVVVIYNLTVKGLPTATQTIFDYGLNWIASRMHNLSTYAVLGHFAVGNGGSTAQSRLADGLAAERYREAPTTAWKESGAAVSCSGTVTTAEGGAFTYDECSPAIGASPPNTETLMQDRTDTANGASFDVDYTSSISLASVT